MAGCLGHSNKPSVYKEEIVLISCFSRRCYGIICRNNNLGSESFFLGYEWERASPSFLSLQSFEWATICSRRKPGGVTSWQPESGNATSVGRSVAPVPDSRGLQMSSHKQHDLIISPVVPLAEPTSHDIMVPTRISWCCVLSGINIFIISIILTYLRRCVTWECVLQASVVWTTVVDSERLF